MHANNHDYCIRITLYLAAVVTPPPPHPRDHVPPSPPGSVPPHLISIITTTNTVGYTDSSNVISAQEQ